VVPERNGPPRDSYLREQAAALAAMIDDPNALASTMNDLEEAASDRAPMCRRCTLLLKVPEWHLNNIQPHGNALESCSKVCSQTSKKILLIIFSAAIGCNGREELHFARHLSSWRMFVETTEQLLQDSFQAMFHS